jgi:hypothetical protein
VTVWGRWRCESVLTICIVIEKVGGRFGGSLVALTKEVATAMHSYEDISHTVVEFMPLNDQVNAFRDV